MPYHSKAELPANVRQLGEHAQTIWMSAFNAAYRQYNGDESKAFAVAWAAANKHKKINSPELVQRRLRSWSPPIWQD